MASDREKEWEELARSEAYFPLLDSRGANEVDGSTDATAEFLATGEADISALLETIAGLEDRELPHRRALDFGCGAGRLTLPLARRADRVVACDIAPTMLSIAEANAGRAGLENITFILPDALADEVPQSFDLICSLLVFQYIPACEGHDLIRTLMNLLGPEGIAVLHITLEASQSGLRRMARLHRTRSYRARREAVAGIAPSITSVRHYNERSVVQVIEGQGARVIARHATSEGNTRGAVFFIRKVQ